ncbi:MAG: sodium:proton antiporter NhaD [Nitrospina sp.]|nr:sodium:proton antiporter NhaD [Nitrospina sp.]
MTTAWVGFLCLAIFIFSYSLVIAEEHIHLRKSKPVIIAGCMMWMFIGIYEHGHSGGHAHKHIVELIAEIGELFFFLLSAMTYINTLAERNVFNALRTWLLSRGMGFRKLFWATGTIAFFLSPLADNLTTALLLSTVALAVSGGNSRFISMSFTNIVVAANAGGAWSPFGDITTLMVWTAGKVPTLQFAYLMVPSIINWLVPAFIMYLFLPDEHPESTKEKVTMKPGAKVVIVLGVCTIATAVSFHQFLHLPPFMGMMLGLGFLMLFGFYLKRWGDRDMLNKMHIPEAHQEEVSHTFDIFKRIETVEFDTLLFFFGVLSAVGALQYLGYLALVSQSLYGTIGPTWSNIVVGVLSAIVDNIPIMYAVLKMDPTMGIDQWLLITLTCGVGGSLLSIGSAAGVATMGVDRKNYTFLSHFKWIWAIALGYAASIVAWWFVTGSLR